MQNQQRRGRCSIASSHFPESVKKYGIPQWKVSACCFLHWLPNRPGSCSWLSLTILPRKIEAIRIFKSWCLPFINDKMNYMSFVFFPSHWSSSKMQLPTFPSFLLTHGIYSLCLPLHTFFCTVIPTFCCLQNLIWYESQKVWLKWASWFK